MATSSKSDFPPSPTNDESEDEELRSDIKKEEEPTDSVARILKQLQNTGALIKKPKQEYRCNTCDKDYGNWEELESHLIQHVTLPSIILDKLPSDDELDHSGDENWSDEDELPETNVSSKVPQKIDVSQLLKNKGIQIKPTTPTKSTDALNKLSGLGFTITKNVIKEEKEERPNNNDLMQKLGNLGGLKLKLKSDGNNSNTFKVVNGLKDFKTSDDEDGSGNEEPNESDEEQQKQLEGSGQESADEQNKESDDSIENNPLAKRKSLSIKPSTKLVTPKVEPAPAPTPEPSTSGIRARPAVKQTPKRGPNNYPLGIQIKQAAQAPAPAKEVPATISPPPDSVAEIPVQNNNATPVVVKTEVEDSTSQSSNSMPVFPDQIKTERSSPPIETISTPLISRVKSETEPVVSDSAQPLFSSQNTATNQPLLPVTKTEEIMTIIEINGDSNDEDDDCCVVSSTPAPDVKPVIPKTENTTSYAPPTSSYPSMQTNYDPKPSRPLVMTEKQHSFNWNAPDSKPAIDILERSADDIFESLLSSTKKEGGSLSDTNEYISLDRLGSQHTCDVCNTRFTDISLLDEHIRTTGHSKSIILPSSSAMMSYGHQPTNPLLASLLPVKQLAEQVGKLSTIGSSPYTHQQNVMINIQAYPGGGMAPPAYNTYSSAQNMPPNYSQPQNNMYGSQGQPMPNQYPGSQYMGQQGYGQQYQPPMSKPSYPGQMPQSPFVNTVVSSPYSTASPLQSMQQAVYGQPQMVSPQSNQLGQMGPPAIPSPSNIYTTSTSSAGSMKPPMTPNGSGIRIQNVQTFSAGQLVGPNGQPVQPGQVTSASPGQLRVAGPSLPALRPRLPAVRGGRPSIRPGIQVQGQVRGARPSGPRMQMKRPAGAPGGPMQKRRTDMLLPGKHDNEDCQVMAMQRQREGLPLIQSVQGAKDKLNLGSQISITKKTVNKEANAMANALASRGISVKKKQKSRSPSPERPVPHIPNLPAGMSIKHTSKSSKFSIPEVGSGGMYSCKVCRKMFMNSSSLGIHMSNAHPQSKVPIFKCDECSAAYPKSLQLQHHKRVFHNVTGPNRELGLPVVDFSLPENLERLSGLGIYSFIPLANREEASGSFGIPVISVHNMQNGVTNHLQALGADGLLSLGPLKPIPKT